jgi:hypothetical protein
MTFFLFRTKMSNLYFITKDWWPTGGDYMHRDGKLHKTTCRDDLTLGTANPYDEEAFPGYWGQASQAIACWNKYYGASSDNVLIDGEKVIILA